MSKIIAIVSGGLDSTTLVYELLNEGHEVDMISFNYGQRHRKELVYARGIQSLFEKTGMRHDVVDLTGLTKLISNSSLTSDQAVPEGHYAEDNMKQTVVPNRNMIMLAIAAGVAVNRNAEWIATGVHAGDHFIYPDCRPDFIAATNLAIAVGNNGFGAWQEFDFATTKNAEEVPTRVLVPFLFQSKADIAYRAMQLGVPLHLTWSCYKGGENHCGRCGTCVERLEAIHDAQQRFYGETGTPYPDHTIYDDVEFWKVQLAKAGAHY